MINPLSILDPQKETKKIVLFIQSSLKKNGFNRIVIGVSGGVDSTTSLYLVRKALPPKNIFIAYLYYFKPHTPLIKRICSSLKIPPQNQCIISIKRPTEEIIKTHQLYNHRGIGRYRVGNIMARVRMIILYDLAKKHNALVCGTENKSEHLLGYFTRFGDEASDIEPIQHLYKSQVLQLAKYLKVPEEIIKTKPSAGLWPGQTDEGQFGFSYQDADQVLYLYFEKKQSPRQIEKLGYNNARKIIDFALQNSFKHQVPYSLK